VTDHRFHFTTHNIDDVINGNLDQLIGALREAQEKERLSA
jgi:protein subunit release factor A